MVTKKKRFNSAFSMLELVVVVAIIAIIAAIGIPRLSRGTRGASDSALTGDLAVLRNAIDLYGAEHGGTYPTVADCNDALLKYTDYSGDIADAKDPTHIYGPYIRKIPPLPVGAKKGKSGIYDMTGTNVGWIYNNTAGTITANCEDSETDDASKKYNEY